jgi:tetratricopeptide (TPR) repeat protein
MTRRPLLYALGLLLLPAALLAQGEADVLRTAKALFVDRQYAEARSLLQGLRQPSSSEVRYWIARCSESLGENERALSEYDEFLASGAAPRMLAAEARTSRIGLAVKEAKAGRPQHLGLVREALADPSRTVRYFAALQLASLGPERGRAAVPVLKEILAKETDEDLVERAKIYLWRLEPKALPEPPAPVPRGGREASWIRVRIYDKGSSRPQLSINLPIALADMVFKSLPSETRKELQLKGYDADHFWERLKKTGPTDILTIDGGDGGRIQVWIE